MPCGYTEVVIAFGLGKFFADAVLVSSTQYIYGNEACPAERISAEIKIVCIAQSYITELGTV